MAASARWSCGNDRQPMTHVSAPLTETPTPGYPPWHPWLLDTPRTQTPWCCKMLRRWKGLKRAMLNNNNNNNNNNSNSDNSDHDHDHDHDHNQEEGEMVQSPFVYLLIFQQSWNTSSLSKSSCLGSATNLYLSFPTFGASTWPSSSTDIPGGEARGNFVTTSGSTGGAPPPTKTSIAPWWLASDRPVPCMIHIRNQLWALNSITSPSGKVQVT